MATYKAYAKINWILNIVGEKDGFHMLDGIMATVGLYDLVTVELRKDRTVNTEYKDMEVMEGDLCKRAAETFFKATEIHGGADIYVEKHIPMGAGLGGGSSDCTCVLTALNDLYGRPLTKEALHSVAAGLGSDMAFFIDGGVQRARGRGEILTPVDGVKPRRIILARPRGEGVSTPAAYRLYDSMPQKEQGNVEAMAAALKRGDSTEICRCMFNSLEKPSEQLVPAIRDVKERLFDAGAEGVMMTGSGSALIGVTGKRDIDESRLGDIWYCICDTVNKAREKVN